MSKQLMHHERKQLRSRIIDSSTITGRRQTKPMTDQLTKMDDKIKDSPSPKKLIKR